MCGFLFDTALAREGYSTGVQDVVAPDSAISLERVVSLIRAISKLRVTVGDGESPVFDVEFGNSRFDNGLLGAYHFGGYLYLTINPCEGVFPTTAIKLFPERVVVGRFDPQDKGFQGNPTLAERSAFVFIRTGLVDWAGGINYHPFGYQGSNTVRIPRAWIAVNKDGVVIYGVPRGKESEMG